MIQELKLKEFDRRLKRLPLAYEQELTLKKGKAENLHIVYVMTHVGVSGGVKIIFEHVNRLASIGVKVSIVTHFEKPQWYPIDAEYIQVPFDLELAKGVPNCDVIVATYWDHIQACVETGIAPVVYFEQGDFHIFEFNSMNKTLKSYIQRQFELPRFIFTVSASTANYIKNIYNRDAKVIPNAIDNKIFFPSKEKKSKPYALMVGAASTKFKGISDIIKAYEIIKKENYELELYWITPEEPSETFKNKVTKYFVQPDQHTISKLYNEASVYVSGSYYESFSLPPLEAMACGCPVVTTNNKGVMEYVNHEENALICNISDPMNMADTIKRVLFESELKSKMILAGHSTATRFNWDTIINEIYQYYQDISRYEVIPASQLKAWDTTVMEDNFLSKDDYTKFIQFIKNSQADLVEVPTIYSIDNKLQIARWEVVANRTNSFQTTIERCYTPIYPNNKLCLLNQSAYRYFYKKDYDAALEEFEKLVEEAHSIKKKTVYFKWIIICLFRLQRRFEAIKRLQEWIDSHSSMYLSEIQFLKIILDTEDYENALHTLSILGDATSLPEFLYDIYNQIPSIVE